jgi:hypothetical protein
MIVPDGHTDPEKLRQLLTAAKETHLDFKACLDFQKTKDRVEFVKDAVTMANRPPGGWSIRANSTARVSTTRAQVHLRRDSNRLPDPPDRRPRLGPGVDPAPP